MSARRRRAGLVLAILLLPVVLLHARRPSRAPMRIAVAPGIDVERLRVDGSVVHRVRLDLARLDAFVTRPDRRGRFVAQTTSDFAARSGARLAVNASFFHPFHSNAPWDFAPRVGEEAAPVGGVVLDGRPNGARDRDWPLLCIEDEVAHVTRGPCGGEGVAGMPLLDDGVIPDGLDPTPQPRTAAGVDGRGRLTLVVVDGRQPLYSEGLPLRRLAEWMRDEGVVDAINLDGGGSTTLVVEGRVWNAPIHTRLPMRQRPVPVHLGFAVNER